MITSLPHILLFGSTTALGTLLSLSSSNWMTIWLGMELNILSFLPLLMASITESSINYFIAQTWASSIFLLGSAVSTSPDLSFISNYMILFALLINAGMPPCHFWFPLVINAVSWTMCLILSSWQKLTPLLILFWGAFDPTPVILISLAGCLFGGLGGLLQTQLRSIIAYSSITHISWISIASSLSPASSSTYLIFYVILIAPIIIHLNNINATTVNSLSSGSIILFLLLASLAGLPPTTGFIINLLILNVISQQIAPIAFILLITTIITLTFYLNIIFVTLIPSSKPSTKVSPHLTIISLASVWLLPALSLC